MTIRNIVIALFVVGVVAGVVGYFVTRRAVAAIRLTGEVDPVTGRAWQTIAEYEATQAVRG